MPAIRHKGLGVIAHVSDDHPALSGSEWELVEAAEPKPAPAPRRRTRKSDDD